MTSFRRVFALLCAVAALTAVTTPMMAACRPESAQAITQIIDPAQTTITRIDSRNFLVFFAVRSNANVSFMCNRVPPGCSVPDGITFKPEFSSNVAAANQTAECRAFQITVNASGNVVAGFRIRFEEANGLAPRRRTYQLLFNTNNLNAKTLVAVNATDLSDL